jgi:hypothetical protein
MAMRCFVCGKKLNIFSDYTQIVVDGKKVEICTPCNRKREKEEVKQLLKSESGQKEVSIRGSILILTGIIEIFFGIFFIFIFKSILGVLSLLLCGFGVYSIYKGVLYKYKARTK